MKILACLVSLGLFASTAQADFYIHAWENHHESPHLLTAGANLIYYRTSTDYDANGKTFTPAGLNSYQRALLDLNGLYGITSRLSAYGRLSWEMSKVDSTSSQAYSGTAFGLGDQTLGLNYRIYQTRKGPTFDLQLQVDFGAYSNANAQSSQTPFLGDASTDVTAGGFLTIPLSHHFNNDLLLLAGAGYTYRTAGFSAELPWSVSARLSPKHKGVLAGLGFFGLQSLNTDSNSTSTSGGSLATSYGSGGSYITNAINPSLITVRGELGYLTSNDLMFSAALGQGIWGHDSPQGTTLMVSFQTHLGGGADHHVDPGLESPHEYGHSDKGYVDYNLEAKVLRTNDRFNLIKIDKGSDDGVQVGDIFDIFMTKPNGTTGEAIARGRVTNVKSNESAVKIEEYYKEVWIDEGFVARRPIE